METGVILAILLSASWAAGQSQPPAIAEALAVLVDVSAAVPPGTTTPPERALLIWVRYAAAPPPPNAAYWIQIQRPDQPTMNVLMTRSEHPPAPAQWIQQTPGQLSPYHLLALKLPVEAGPISAARLAYFAEPPWLVPRWTEIQIPAPASSRKLPLQPD
jgi:hypothetical protein